MRGRGRTPRSWEAAPTGTSPSGCPRRTPRSTSRASSVRGTSSRTRLTWRVSCPPFRAGAEAGLGPGTVDDAGPGMGRRRRPDTPVVLPSTTRSRSPPANPATSRRWPSGSWPGRHRPAVGRRRVDTSHPGGGLDEIGERARDSVMVVEGPIVSFARPRRWRTAGPQRTSSAGPPPSGHCSVNGSTPIRHQRLDTQQDPRRADPDGHPTIGPPLYAGAHLARAALDADAPRWFSDLNEDPRNRVVAGCRVHASCSTIRRRSWPRPGTRWSASRPPTPPCGSPSSAAMSVPRSTAATRTARPGLAARRHPRRPPPAPRRAGPDRAGADRGTAPCPWP